MISIVYSLVLAAPAAAHIAMWHEAMYGQNWTEGEDSHIPANPLMDLSFNDWWFHGNIDRPPHDGVFMELPAGGVFTGETSCQKSYTSLQPDRDTTADPYACDNWRTQPVLGAMHTLDDIGTPLDKLWDVKGCALAIAYESDVHKIKPEDFTVISVNHACVYHNKVDFQIPQLPACPPGGCHCQWAWVHSAQGGSTQIYFVGYRCTVTGAAVDAPPVAKGQIARKCPYDKNNCTAGAKQPLYWLQKEGTNIQQAWNDPPVYNEEYGFKNGAQNDFWYTDSGDHWNKNESDLAPIAYSTYTSGTANLFPTFVPPAITPATYTVPSTPTGNVRRQEAVQQTNAMAAPTRPAVHKKRLRH